MKIKRQLIWSLIGEIDPNILFERIKKLHPNTKYFNPLDPHYNGISINDLSVLNGVKIQNLLSGYVMSIKDKDVSDKKIHEKLRLGLANSQGIDSDNDTISLDDDYL